ncbi:MAG TPA: hypothetical protein VLC09_14775, partial [Polyangiaceae bacterium]|nr:hypothetical protein [Polyangiaceae bacterium]
MRHPIRCKLSPFTFVGVLSLTTGARATEAEASEDNPSERTYATHFSGADEDGPWPRVGLGGGVAA